ncbi:MAG: Arm DNA-binding domain-containing protein, partial [Psychroflexus sp.]|nr:Arm DNA-binding domain-containing protein [Psychroflexus sp.]
IALDSKRAECSLNRKVHIDLWSTRSQKALGNSPENQEINREIDFIKNKIYSIEQKFQRDGIVYSAAQLRDVYLGKDKTEKMLLEIFQEHNDKVNSLIGRDFAAGIAERYRTCKKHVEGFIKEKYKKNDIPVGCGPSINITVIRKIEQNKTNLNLDKLNKVLNGQDDFKCLFFFVGN